LKINSTVGGSTKGSGNSAATIQRLDFLQRLLSGLATEIPDSDVPGFIAEARSLDMVNPMAFDVSSAISKCWS
jgi:hypothetical protein